MQRKQNNALPFSYRAIGIALFALCLLLLLWVAGHVHPDLATAASPTQSASGASGTAAASTAGTARTAEADLVGRFEQYVNNDVHAHALEDLTYIERHYAIPESALIAPRPDPARFGETDDPAVVQAVVESAAALLGGQKLAWNPDIAFMPARSNTTATRRSWSSPGRRRWATAPCPSARSRPPTARRSAAISSTTATARTCSSMPRTWPGTSTRSSRSTAISTPSARSASRSTPASCTATRARRWTPASSRRAAI